MNSRGQFFSPDLIVALGVFVFALIIFFSASASLFSQSNIYEDRKGIDEAAHKTVDLLVLSPGSPSNWENLPLSGAYSIGLALSNNSISAAKAVFLIRQLNDPAGYLVLKDKLGLGPYDFYLRILDSEGAVISSNNVSLAGGVVSSDPKLTFSYKREVIFGGAPAVLEAVFSISD